MKNWLLLVYGRAFTFATARALALAGRKGGVLAEHAERGGEIREQQDTCPAARSRRQSSTGPGANST